MLGIRGLIWRMTMQIATAALGVEHLAGLANAYTYHLIDEIDKGVDVCSLHDRTGAAVCTSSAFIWQKTWVCHHAL